MKKMDEMDRNLQLRSEEWGYRFLVLALSMWTLFNSWQTIVNGEKYKPFPCLILCLSICVQSFTQMAMKEKMVEGDDEYKEPSKLVPSIIFSIVLFTVIVSIGTFIMLKE